MRLLNCYWVEYASIYVINTSIAFTRASNSVGSFSIHVCYSGVSSVIDKVMDLSWFILLPCSIIMITMQYHMMVSTHRNILLLHHTSASSQPYYCIITTSHYHNHSHTSINSSHPFIHRHSPSIMYESLLVPTSSPGVSSLARTRPGIGRNTVWRVEVFTTAPLPTYNTIERDEWGW